MQPDKKEKLIVVLGPTAVGKTKLSIDLAKALDTEIISGDSMLVYKGFDIGTAKPTRQEMDGVVHHLIDILEPQENFNVADFHRLAKPVISRLNRQGKVPILAGGTGLYVKSLLEGYAFNETSGDAAYRAHLEALAQRHGRQYVYDMLVQADPHTAQRLHVNNFQRIIRALEVHHLGNEQISQESYFAGTGELAYDVCVIGLRRERADLYDRINRRVDLMMADGFENEVRQLLQSGVKPGCQPMKGIGYREMAAHLRGELSLEAAVEEMKKATRHFAKRQFTWYKKMPYAQWYDADKMQYEDLADEIIERCKEFAGTRH